MIAVKHLILDVLKPHQPSALEFSSTIAAVGPDYHVHLIVMEVDERTETLQVEIIGNDIDFGGVKAAITEMGGSLHSVDEVEVQNTPDKETGLE